MRHDGHQICEFPAVLAIHSSHLTHGNKKRFDLLRYGTQTGYGEPDSIGTAFIRGAPSRYPGPDWRRLGDQARITEFHWAHLLSYAALDPEMASANRRSVATPGSYCRIFSRRSAGTAMAGKFSQVRLRVIALCVVQARAGGFRRQFSFMSLILTSPRN